MLKNMDFGVSNQRQGPPTTSHRQHQRGMCACINSNAYHSTPHCMAQVQRTQHLVYTKLVSCVYCERATPIQFSAFKLQTVTGDRRRVLQGSLAMLVLTSEQKWQAKAEEGPVVRLDLAPDQTKYDPADEGLRNAAFLLQKALNAESVQEEERLWTELIEKYSSSDAIWKADIVGRAFGNRGNARSRQGKMEDALSDFGEAIALCPWSVDPLLNRGVVYEALGRYDDAVTDYKAVLKAAPNDPSGWNNLGNVRMAQGAWKDAAEFYGKAYRIAPQFSFAAANQSLALYQQGNIKDAVREMRTLLRRFPDFPDMRAALAAASWEAGDIGEAENNWARVEDPRYGDVQWLTKWRRWPPRIRQDLESFLKLRAPPTAGLQPS